MRVHIRISDPWNLSELAELSGDIVEQSADEMVVHLEVPLNVGDSSYSIASLRPRHSGNSLASDWTTLQVNIALTADEGRRPAPANLIAVGSVRRVR